METPCTNISENLSNQSKARYESFCFLSVSSVSMVLCLVTRDPYIREQLQCNKFGPIIIFIISHLFNDKQSLKKDWDKVEKMMIVAPNMVVSRLVPSSSKNFNREICSLTTTPSLSINPTV